MHSESSRAPAPEQKNAQSNPPLKFGVIGAEGRGRLAQNVHRPDEGTFLSAACTLHPERIMGMKDTFGPDFLVARDYHELIAAEELDAVFVCSPDHLHEEHALAAIEAGKSVYLEKPMAITIAGCDRLLQAAEAHGVLLYPGHNMRFMPVMRKLRELIAAGRIGRVEAIWCRHFISYGGDAYFRDWHSERCNTTGLLLQKGAHDIDMIHWFAGAHTRRVVAMGKLSVYDKLPRRRPEEPMPRAKFDRSKYPPGQTSGYSPVIDVEDHSMVLLELANGVQASYVQCHYTPDDQRNYTIIGTEGRIENYGDNSTADKWATVHLWDRRTGHQEHGHEVFRIPHLEGTHGGADPLVVEDFVRTLRGHPSQGATPLDARMATAAGCLATESLREGNQPKEMPPPPDGFTDD